MLKWEGYAMTNFIEMNDEYINRLAVLETKLDYLIEHINDSKTATLGLAKRVDSLENDRHWIRGIAACLVVVSTALGFAANGYIRAVVSDEVNAAQVIDDICLYYKRNKTANMEQPSICQI